jgi:hypothetical protein
MQIPELICPKKDLYDYMTRRAANGGIDPTKLRRKPAGKITVQQYPTHTLRRRAVGHYCS